MKRISFLLTFILLVRTGYGQVIADHTVVDRYDEIPQQYIDEVKKMWVSLAGESHSGAFRVGALLLESQDPRFAVSVIDQGVPEPYTANNLRLSRATWGDHDQVTGWVYDYGEEDFWTNSTAITRTKAGLLYCQNNGPSLAALGFSWCWDATWQNDVGGGYDPIYQTRFAGASFEGPDGNLRWGIDDEDISLTGNHVSMLTYIRAMHDYIDYCAANDITTAMIWTTGPVDNDSDMALGESGYQQYLKYEYLRDHIDSLDNAWFIDYADILSYNDAGEQATTSWTDYGGSLQTFPIIHGDNMVEWNNTYHFGSNGALRLAKAMWWLLARIAGWDGIVATTWTGAASESWNDPGNWSNGLPDRYCNVTIPTVARMPVIDPYGEAECNDLEIQSGALLTILSDERWTGSLIVHGTSSGTVSLQVQLPADDLYHYVSSPLLSPTLPSSGIFWAWDEVSGDWGKPVLACESGRGYTTRGNNLLTFQGGIIVDTVTLQTTSPYADCDFPYGVVTDYSLRTFSDGRDNSTSYGGGGWNLLGNPYTSALDIIGFINENELSFDQNYRAVYIYNGDTYQYAGTELAGWEQSGTYYSSPHIHTGQGFFVASRCNTSLFSFTPGMRTENNSVVLLKSAAARSPLPGLELTARSDNAVSSTLVVYGERMSAGLDPGYDIGLMNSGDNPVIYTLLAAEDNGVSFARQALPLFQVTRLKVAVGLDFRAGGEITFSARTVPAGMSRFWLEDRETGIVTDLSSGSYTVTIPPDTYGAGRFFISASSGSPTSISTVDEQADKIRIWASGDRIIIRGNIREGAVAGLFNLRGQKLLESVLSEGELNIIDLPHGNHGVFVVNITDGTFSVSGKIIIP
jgi:hypothetical protein